MGRIDRLKLQWAFAGLFIILGLGYSTFTPIFENSDETLHYPYVKHLADGFGLPLALPNQLWNQEGTQPPLYYAIVAATTFWIDSDNLPEHLQINPHWRFTEVRSLINDNQNVLLHGPQDNFPYRRAALAIHIGRWWSILFGLVTVLCTFLIAQHLFPNNLALAISATALTALTPQFLRVSATVSNDSLSAALTSLTVLLALRFTDINRISKQQLATPLPASLPNRYAVILGVLAGLALMTKLSSLSVFFLAAFIIFWRLFLLTELHQRPIQSMLRWLLIISGITVAMSGWWFVRNTQLYGEWLALETHLNLAGRGHLTLTDVWNLRAEAERAFWLTLGWGQLRPSEWVYQLLGWFSHIGLTALGLAVLVKLIQGNRSRPVPLNLGAIDFEKIIFLSFWAALNLILYVRWVTEVGSVSHTRLIFPAITAISLLLALGWQALLPHQLHIWFATLLTTALLMLNVYSLGWLIIPAFTPTGPESEAVQLDSTLDLTFLDSLKLIGGAAHDDRQDGSSAGQGDMVTIRARWQAIAPLVKNYSVSAVLLAPDGSVLAHRESYPGLGLRPTRYLNPDDIFTDSYPLNLATDVAEPMIARAVVSLFDFDSETRAGFPALDPGGNEVTPIVGRIKLIPKVWPIYEPMYGTAVNFADKIALTGYDFDRNQPQSLTLYWQSMTPVDEDYNLFIHLLDPDGNIIGQADAPPTNSSYPTSWWARGELIADNHFLPDTTTATHLRLGIYSLATGQRLPIIKADLPNFDSSIELKLPAGN